MTINVTKPKPKNHAPILDAEVCFALWKEKGSLDLVSAFLAEHGVVNPLTGKAYTKGAIHQAVQQASGYKNYAASKAKKVQSSEAAMQKLKDMVVKK